MQQIAFGELEMSAKDFWDSSPLEFYYRQKGHYQKVENLERQEWERFRWIVFQSKIEIKPKKAGFISLQDIAVFPWEEEKIQENEQPMNPEIMAKVIAAMDAHSNH
mgnify:CR=1 FL=1